MNPEGLLEKEYMGINRDIKELEYKVGDFISISIYLYTYLVDIKKT